MVEGYGDKEAGLGGPGLGAANKAGYKIRCAEDSATSEDSAAESAAESNACWSGSQKARRTRP